MASPLPRLSVVLDAVHLGSMAVWLGGLVMLFGFLLRRARADELDAILPVWSRWALAAVVALVGAGSAQALIEVGSLPALTGTGYGRLLLVKIGLFVVVIAVAWHSRRLVSLSVAGTALASHGPDTATAGVVGSRGPVAASGAGPADVSGDAGPVAAGDVERAAAGDVERAAAGDVERAAAGDVEPVAGGDAGPVAGGDAGPVADGDVERVADGDGSGAAGTDRPGPAETDGPGAGRRSTRLRRAVGVELGITAVVLALTATLTQTTPARTAAQTASAGQFDTTLTSPLYSLQVQVEPGRVGFNGVHLYAYTPSGASLPVVEWKVTAALPAAGLEPIEVPLARLAENHVSGEFRAEPAGRWEFRFTLRTSDINQATVTATVPIT